MPDKNDIIKIIAEALLIDYSSVYYVNAVTNEYQWYSCDPEFHSLHIEQGGKDFFKNLVRDAEKVVYEEDKHIFTQDMQKEKLISQMKKGTMQNIQYRLMIDGVPVYHTLRLIRGISEGDDYFILGVINIDKEVKMKQAAEKLRHDNEIFNKIAQTLAGKFDTLYYVDINTNKYIEYSSNDDYKNLGIPSSGDDFFAESRRNIRKYVHPDDQEIVLDLHYKENMIKNLTDRHSFTTTYRLIIDGKTVHYRHSESWDSSKSHIIVSMENIEEEIIAQKALKEKEEKSAIYELIAKSLASHYDIIYYVDINENNYAEFTANNIFGSLNLNFEGKDFFKEAFENIEKVIHPKDKSRIREVLTKDKLITTLEAKKQYSVDYRMIVDNKPQFTRFTAIWANDKNHLIIGVENIDEQVKKENQQIQALNQANELARRDELTGTKNKTAFHELEATVQEKIDKNEEILRFAIVVCDINNLKMINDTMGHKAGDDYIRAASRLICNVFTHSPVFRVGGDEFVAFLGSSDYNIKETLFARLCDQVRENIKNGDGPVVAAGMAVYDPASDTKFSDVFQRADRIMYGDKSDLKSGKIVRPSNKEEIPEEALIKLDRLYEAFELVAEGAYVYLCDMRYNYSRWSKAAVNCFGLPSEYMYDAGSIWEDYIHPEDKSIYRSGISDIFAGNASDHDMQYRARKPNGSYDVCTCRGIVLREPSGKPGYFAGIIRNHGIQGHVDALTGLRNQYGFFEDLQLNMSKHQELNVCMIVINKFSELNEVYGYQFGNSILQKFGRYLFEHVGNTGNAYRLDGTKFAVISKTQTVDDMKSNYEKLRNHFRKGFNLDNKCVILDLSGGMLTVDNYDIDHQTVYACLNFAYSESKLRRQGELVEFYNDLNDQNKHRLEKLYAIRASIMQNYKGFYLLYQPVVDANTEKLIGAEALLRWRSDDYGMVPPDHFIPILEKDPLFCDLGQWILRTAINGAKLVMEDHPDFVINVNLSYTQLEKPDFVDMVLRTLKEEGFPPEHLCMEITERCRLLDMYLLKNVIVNLRGHGIQIALDDFGTGFSSIGLVKNLPFDTIKIDRSFVLKIEDDAKERELIKSFAGVASTFGAKVCVEGIETEGMRDILQQYHIQSFQGYYYGKPLELRDFLIWKPASEK